MGKSSSVDQFTRKLGQAAQDIGDTRPGLRAAGMAGKGIFLAAAGGTVGTKPAGKRKIISARYDLARDGKSVVVTYTGPAHLVNSPTKPHQIVPRKRRRKGGGKALTIGENLRPAADHPGTKGKRFFPKAAAETAKVAPRVYEIEGVKAPLRKVFR